MKRDRVAHSIWPVIPSKCATKPLSASEISSDKLTSFGQGRLQPLKVILAHSNRRVFRPAPVDNRHVLEEIRGEAADINDLAHRTVDAGDFAQAPASDGIERVHQILRTRFMTSGAKPKTTRARTPERSDSRQFTLGLIDAKAALCNSKLSQNKRA